MSFKEVHTLSELVEHLTALQRERQEQGLGDLYIFSDSRLEDGVAPGIEVEVAEIKRREVQGKLPLGQGSHGGKSDYIPGDGETGEALLMGHHYSW